MSLSFWPKDGQNSSKKLSRKNPIKNLSFETPHRVKEKHNEENQILSELLSDLQVALNDKSKLQIDCNALKTEVMELRQKNDSLQKTIEGNRRKFEQDSSELQEKLKNHENSAKNYLSDAKRCSKELCEVKNENERLKNFVAKTELEMAEKVRRLQSDFNASEIRGTTFRIQYEEFMQKTEKYKAKLRYAITVINELNNILIQTTVTPEMCSSYTQTENETFTLDQCCSQCPPTCQKQSTYEEHILLSDIFFKPKSFCENELMLFNKLELCQDK